MTQLTISDSLAETIAGAANDRGRTSEQRSWMGVVTWIASCMSE